jgi:Leu/Phe-tRNA-protein transferase
VPGNCFTHNKKDSVPEAWVAPCFSQVYRVLKENSYCVSFYGWQHIEKLGEELTR